MLGIFGEFKMSHPFDDFLSESWHEKKKDRRVFRYGLILVGIVVIATVWAFTTTMSHWKTISIDQQTVAARWEDAQQRINGYLKSERTLRKKVEEAKAISKLLDTVPKSLLLSELSVVLPHEALLSSIRIESRTRPNEEGISMTTEIINITGEAPSDASISRFVENLMQSEFFNNVSLQYSQQKQGGEQRDFSIGMEIQIPFNTMYSEAKE
jgi:Tfp pilus assembly protein PilN